VNVPPVAAQVQYGDGFRATNTVEIMNDSNPYEIARDVDSDDDRPVGELTESDVEMLRCIFPDHCNPRVHEFSDLVHSNQAFAEGQDDELLEAPEAGPSMVIEKERVFKDFPALKRWLQQFAVIHKDLTRSCIHMRSGIIQLFVTRNTANGRFVQGSKRSSKNGRSQKLSGHTPVLNMCSH
jgi:hypothetical protein